MTSLIHHGRHIFTTANSYNFCFNGAILKILSPMAYFERVIYDELKHIHFNTIFNILQWTVPQLSLMIIYNSTWSILIQWIRAILSGDNLT